MSPDNSNFQLPKNFISALHSEECILFIGAGLSLWSGLPSWKTLLEKMVTFLHDHGISQDEYDEITQIIQKGDLLTAASLCKSLMNMSRFRDFIDEVFIKPNPQPHVIHKLVVDLGPDSFITTNYDRLIDNAYQSVHNGQVLFPVNNEQPIEQARIARHGASKFIFFPHGKIDKCATIVLSREDYRDLYHKSQSTITTLHHLMISRPVVYIGFGLKDPDFLMIKDEISATYSGGERDHYAIMPNVSELQKKFWLDQYGIHIISYSAPNGNHSNLLELIEHLQTLNDASKETEVIEHNQMKFGLMRYCEDLIHKYKNIMLNSFELTVSMRKDLSREIEIDLDVRSNFPERDISVLKILDVYGKVIILGDPGSGKSHSIIQLASLMSSELLVKLKESSNFSELDLKHSIPIILSMKAYNGDIKQMIKSRLPRSLDIDYLLNNNLLVIFIDAVNETPRNLVESRVLANNILWLLNMYPNNQYCFTSRTMGYVSYLKMPVFEMQPINTISIERYIKQMSSVEFKQIKRSMIKILRNPLFLKMYSELSINQSESITEINLISEYISNVEDKIRNNSRFKDVSLITLFSKISYNMINEGVQLIQPEYVINEFKIYVNIDNANENAIELFNTLLSFNLLTLDSEGKIGFIHQTILEYFGATEILSRYREDKNTIYENLNYHRWDETIILFNSFLDAEESIEFIDKITDFDLMFASRAFNSATYKNEKVGLQIFDIITKILVKSSTSRAEKSHLSNALKLLVPYGRTEILYQLLDDEPEVSRVAAYFLANLKADGIIPKILELLSKDNIWPSLYSTALELLVDESNIDDLIDYGKNIKEDSLVISNLSKLISSFSYPKILPKVQCLLNSELTKDRLFGIRILDQVQTPEADELLVDMLSDSDVDIQSTAVTSLSFRNRNEPYKTDRTIAYMFNILGNKTSGRWAANYLIQVMDEEIITKVNNLIPKAKNNIKTINLYGILAKIDPVISQNILFNYLDNYNADYHEELSHALSSLPIEVLLPNVLAYLNEDDEEKHLTVLEGLRGSIRYQKQIDITEEQYDLLFTFWENCTSYMAHHISGQFLAQNCTSISKKLLLEKIEDDNYIYRTRLFELISKLPLVQGDISPETTDWIINQLGYPSPYSIHPLYEPKSTILGKTINEYTLIEKIFPLLNSSNEILRNNAYITIKAVENNLGKRYLKPTNNQP